MSEAKKFNAAVLYAPAISMVMAAAIPDVNNSDRPDAFRIIYLVVAMVIFVIALVALVMGYCKGSSFKEEIFNPTAIHFYSSIPLFWGYMIVTLNDYIKTGDKKDGYYDWIDAARYVYLILMLLCLLLIGISYLWHFGPECFNFEMTITLEALMCYPTIWKYHLWEWDDYFKSHKDIVITIMMILLLKNLQSGKDYVLNAVALGSSVMYATGSFTDGFLLLAVLLVLMFPSDYTKFITLDNWLPIIWSPIAFGLLSSIDYKSESRFYQDSIAFLHILLSIPAQIMLIVYIFMAVLGKTKN